MDVCFHRDPAFGERGGRSFLRGFKIKKYIKLYVKMPCKRVSLNLGGHFGEPGGDSLDGTF